MNADPPLLTLTHLAKSYRLGRNPFDLLRGREGGNGGEANQVHAVRNVSITVRRGETVGIVGRNGSGKSTLLELICGILKPSGGTVEVHGRIAALLELGAGFNPEFTGRENIFLNAALLGLSRRQVEERLGQIIDFSGIGEFVDRPVKTYSSGMFVRLAFSVAAHTDPDLLVVDEALAVGDEAFQRKCYSRIRLLQQQGVTILFVTHSAATVVDIATRAILMERGELVMDGPPKQVIAQYHRMLSNADKQDAAAARALIASGDKALEVRGGGAAEERIDPDWFDPELKPQSTIRYLRRGAEIDNLRILTPDNRIVNVLETGARYRYAYDVHFSEDAANVRFGLLFKTISGYELGGGNTATLETSMDQVGAGSTITVRFGFRASLNTGSYFMNAGVLGTLEGEELYLDRVIDGLMFRVVKLKDSFSLGIVDFEIVPELMQRAAPPPAAPHATGYPQP